jgi:gentisate 1,2-dioxygenase
MATETETITTPIISQESKTSVEAINMPDELALAVEKFHTKPLWTRMAKLNPPLPNPSCVPHIWRYDQIRPSLLKAGELVGESQAERRVLMLVNPARGKMPL